MDIHITLQGKTDLAGQIYRQLRASIVDGRLAAGERLPSTRDLASQLSVSRKTTLDVFERLLSEGFLQSRPGDGTFVADGLQRIPVSSPIVHRARPTALWESLPAALSMPEYGSTPPLDFLGGVTDKSRFPFEPWRRCLNHAQRQQARGRAAYHDPAGEQELRLGISRYLAFNRAVTSNWQDVIVTHGAQQALDLLARVTLNPGDVVAMEEPGYPPARACFTAAGAKVISVPVDAEGLRVDLLPKEARLVYVTPSHQFPLGMPLSLDRRLALLEWAQNTGAAIVEDDYDGEFRFDGRPLESLKCLDRFGLVAYVGTFSKTMFPELRVGYIVPPLSLSAALLKAKQIVDWHSSTFTQAAIARFILDGDFAKHLRRIYKQYEARRDVLLKHLNGPLAAWLVPVIPAAGIHLTAVLKQGLTEASVISAAREQGVGLYGISSFYADTEPRQGLLFGYGGISEEEIEIALNKLADVFRALG
ncbi:MocR-like pyridoxine biosynthesis transcription factor PdxR [Silvimonas amylolytica]|uniref:Putative 8-amino-7-oxononanoate synthase n=1 Tax=Silvimonas amylolytica TaxID=449663 RepID=A0ABQ2PF34_9NEIS|nr:PLP-dependent aminotransferase family protein [Silvimonas amylolytica]GGP24184.1 GntR family transcriptional regulator [Silvimonas amylolytica]